MRLTHLAYLESGLRHSTTLAFGRSSKQPPFRVVEQQASGQAVVGAGSLNQWQLLEH